MVVVGYRTKGKNLANVSSCRVHTVLLGVVEDEVDSDTQMFDGWQVLVALARFFAIDDRGQDWKAFSQVFLLAGSGLHYW